SSGRLLARRPLRASTRERPAPVPTSGRRRRSRDVLSWRVFLWRDASSSRLLSLVDFSIIASPPSRQTSSEVRGSGGLNQQVIMIRHQSIGMIDPVVARYDVSESLKKQLAVAVVEKDRLAGITPTSQMINRSGKFQAKRPCHGELQSGHLLDCRPEAITLVLR